MAESLDGCETAQRIHTLLDDVVVNLVDILGFDELGRVFLECGESVANAKDRQ